MRTITATRSLVLGGVLAGVLALGAVQASGDDAPVAELKAGSSSRSTQAAVDDDRSKAPTTSERGIVLEGTGTWRGRPVAIFVYENQRYGNSLQMVIGDPDGDHAIGAGEGRDPYVIDGVLDVGLEVDGDLAVVRGSVIESGDPRPATGSDTDGELVATTGTHTPLLVEATFDYRGETVDLRFATSFAYDLESQRSVD